MKKILLLIALILALGIAATMYWTRGEEVEELSSEKITRLGITSYSLEGQVVSVSAGKVLVSVGRVEKTAGGNEFVVSEKEFTLAPQVSLTDGATTRNVAAASLATYVKKSDRAVFAGTATTSPFSGGIFTVEKITITSRGTPIAPPPLPRS